MRHAATLLVFLIEAVGLALGGGKPFPPPKFIPVNVPGESVFQVTDINNSGMMVGNGLAGTYSGCFAISGNNAYKISWPHALETDCFGINSAGAVVGMYIMKFGGNPSGFIYQNKQYTSIDAGTGYTVAWAVNDLNQVVGYYATNDNKAHGFLWNGSTFQTIDPPGSITTAIQGINNHGQMAIDWYDGTTNFAAIYDGTTYTNVAVPGAIQTQVFNINNFGDVAITWEDAQSIERAAALKGGHYYTFGYPGYGSNAAFGINDQDIVVGFSGSGSGYTGYKLIP